MENLHIFLSRLPILFNFNRKYVQPIAIRIISGGKNSGFIVQEVFCGNACTQNVLINSFLFRNIC